MYLDTSSFLNFLLPSPLVASVGAALGREPVVIFSPLTELETRVQLRARYLGGLLSEPIYQDLLRRVDGLSSEEPFALATLSSTLLATALRQHAASDIHVRALDRMHLAAMEELGIRRLMTNDLRQAKAARALGFEVVIPEANDTGDGGGNGLA
jgi:predicted nucleic acid-binding protein